MQGLLRVLACAGIVWATCAMNCFGDVIAGPGFVPELSGGGFFVGTYTLASGTSVNYSVAQLVPAFYSYSDLILQVQLSWVGTIDFALAPDGNDGSPGSPIATTSITLTPVDANLATYSLPLNATLQAGTWYWLIASSPEVQSLTGNNPTLLPSWQLSPGVDYPIAYSYDGGPWMFTSNESFAYELDGQVDGSTYLIPTPTPAPRVAPEPRVVFPLLGILLMIGYVGTRLRGSS